MIKKWLNLPRSTTLAAIYHPSVLALLFFPHFRLKAKVDYLRAISTSQDPILCELVANLSERNLRKSIPTSALDLLQAARSSIKELPSVNPARQLNKAARDTTQAHQASYWNNHLDTLAVQSKFKDIILLEAGCKIWTRIQAGLPAGQLSFMLKAGADCLPTPLNLCRWRIQTDPKCPLCLWPKPTSAHILNGCSIYSSESRAIHMAT